MQPVFQPISWTPAPAETQAVPDPWHHPGPGVSREPMIRRYRDQKGYWHITNVLPAEKIQPTMPAAAAFNPDQALANMMQVPAAAARLEAAALADARAAGNRLTIKSLLDRHGIRHISNGPTAGPGQIFQNPLAFLANLQGGLGAIIHEATELYRLPASLVLAVIKMESNFIPWAVSPKGAMGLMQLMPGTAMELGVQDPFNPRENIAAGCRYLRSLLDQFQGSLPLAMAAYNAGQQRVISCGYTVPPIKETQEFVTGVLELYYLIEKTGQRL